MEFKCVNNKHDHISEKHVNVHDARRDETTAPFWSFADEIFKLLAELFIYADVSQMLQALTQSNWQNTGLSKARMEHHRPHHLTAATT